MRRLLLVWLSCCLFAGPALAKGSHSKRSHKSVKHRAHHHRRHK